MSHPKIEETIAAIATPVGVGGMSVIRVSGERAFAVVDRVFRPQKGRLLEFAAQTLHFGEVVRESGALVDRAMVGLFRSPQSYTGEDVVEISVHGGLVVSRAVLDLLLRGGARLAEPGEFTKRAFLNGKIDLTQAEAVLELIHAKSTKSMETAVRQLAGALSAEFRKIKDALMKIYAHLEAYLDFPDEQLEIFRDAQFLDRFRGVRSQIERLAASFRRGSILKEGVVVAIVGKPNTGKSSLFNALLERDRAIVSEYPGTTRDTLEEAIEIDGIYVRLTDTAGLDQDLEHPLDRISMQRTREALGAASICLWLLDGSGPFEEADRAVLAAAGPDKRIITLINKVDLPERLDPGTLAPWAGAGGVLKISVKTREGLDQLERRIAETISQETFSQEEGEQVTRLRHLHALERALAALQRAEASFAKEESLEYVIVDLRESLDCLRELIGEIYSEDLLDVIFSEFCIGK